MKKIMLFPVFNNMFSRIIFQANRGGYVKGLMMLLLLFLSIKISFAQTVSLYVGETSLLVCPDPPLSNAAIFQCAWSSSHASLSVSPTGYANCGCYVTVDDYFTGVAQVRCDYYWRWYVGNVQHTNHATTYYSITCIPININLNHSNLSLRVGQSQYLSYSSSPSSAPSPTVTWSSSDYGVATVNNSGRVEAISAGSAIITAHNSSGPNATCYVTVTPNSPTSINLSAHQVTIDPGQSYSLSHTVYPTNVSYTLHWESNNTSVATVSSGTIHGVRSGHARITASLVGTSLYDTCHVVVRNIAPTSISIPHNMTILCGHSMTITPTVIPTDANYSITWTSNNNSVATVNNGMVQGLSEGVAVITARVAGTTLYDTCHVEVIPNRPTSISIPNTLVINLGQDTTLYPIIQPTGADCSLLWSSSNEHVATVNDGYVQGIGEGSTRITVRVSGLSLSDTCMVSVVRTPLSLYASQPAGWVEQGTAVSLAASDNLAAIYYTLDGSRPDSNSILYSDPILINNNLTLRAIAYHHNYYPSPELCNEYRVRSLQIVSQYPENNTIHSYSPIPSVTFNNPIFPNDKFDSIEFHNAQGEIIPGELIISGNTLSFIPYNDVDTGIHLLIIPDSAIKTSDGEPNIAHSFCYFVRNTPCNPIINAGFCSYLTMDGTLYRWFGCGAYTFPYATNRTSTIPISVMTDVKDFYLTMIEQNYVIKSDCSLWAWGSSSDYSPLGDGSLTNRSTPVFIADSISKMMMDGMHGMYHGAGMLTYSGDLYTWGSNHSLNFGYLGRRTTGSYYTPTLIMHNIRDFYMHGWFGVALTTDSMLYVWGNKSCIGSSNNQVNPMLKTTFKITEIAAGLEHVLALRDNGIVLAFGNNNVYQLGNTNTSTTTTTYTPISDVRHIAACGGVSAAIKNDNTLWVWGTFNYTYIGVQTIAQTPQMVLDSVDRVFVSQDAVYALREDGSLWGMGYNGIIYTSIMNKIMDDVADCWISEEVACRYVLKKDNSFWGWGYDMPNIPSVSHTSVPFKIIDGCSSLQNITFDTAVLFDTIGIGRKMVLNPLLFPSNGVFDTLFWTSSDTTIASVSSRGIVKAVSPGCATITCIVEVDDTVMQASVHIVCASVDTIIACDSCVWHGKKYYSSNKTDVFITSFNADGCDSVIILDLTINHSVSVTRTETAQSSYLWHGNTYSESGTYEWHGLTVDGCDSTETLILVIDQNGFEEDGDNNLNITVYPNPTLGRLTIKADDVISVEVFDYLGRIVATHKESNQIDLSRLPAGSYILKIRLQRGVSVQHVVVE